MASSAALPASVSLPDPRPAALRALRVDATAALANAVSRGDATAMAQLADALAQIAAQLGDFDAVGAAHELLATSWDRQRDLVVLVGSNAFAAGASLAAAGHRRVFCLDPEAPEVAASAREMPAVVNARTLEELERACWWIAWPHPAQLRVRVVGPGAPVPPDVLVARLERTLRALDQAGEEIETSALPFLHCATNNLRHIADVPSIEPLAGLFRGRPAVIVAAGPSLDKNLHLLPGMQGRAVVIAINQTVRALRRVGVSPDVVVAVDPQNLGYQFEGVGADEIGMLCLGASVGPAAFAIPAANRVTFAASPMPEGWIYEAMGEQAGLQSGGSVATAAIQVALHLGCSPIILLGRDLALSGRSYYAKDAADGGQELALAEDGKSFHLGSMTSKLELATPASREGLRQRLAATKLEPVQVPGWDGTSVTTYPGFVFELDILRALVDRARGTAHFINATEGGAYLEGMEHLSFAQVIAREAPTRFDARAAISGALATVDLAARRERLRTGLVQLTRDMEHATKLARRCAKLCARTRAGRPHALEEAGAELDRLGRTRPLLTILTQKIMRDIQRRDQQGWTDLDEVLAAERALYFSLANVAGDLARRLGEQLAGMGTS